MLKRLTLSAAVGLAALVGVSHQAAAQIFSDTSIGYRYGSSFKEPGISDSKNPHGVDINKNILSVGHVDGWTYGSNFFNLDLLKSGSRDPAVGGGSGAFEAYFLYRGDLSPNAIFKTNMFTFGPVRDITLQAGFDLNTKNTTFASQKDLIVIGPNIHFNTPGFLNVAFLLGKEWNHNGITKTTPNFNPQLITSFVFSVPLEFMKFASFRIDGFTNVNSPKGKDGFNAKTRWEVLSQTRLVLDAGELILSKPRFLDVYFGFEYWLNKFGNDHNKTPGSLAYTPMFGTAIHF